MRRYLRTKSNCSRGQKKFHIQSSAFHTIPSTPAGFRTRWISFKESLLENQWNACRDLLDSKNQGLVCGRTMCM